MKTPFIKRFFNIWFGEDISLSVQVFHLLGFIGVLLGFINALAETLTDLRPAHIFLNLASGLFAAFLMYFAKRTNKYRICSIITVIVVFLIVFPMLYFTGDGYGGTLLMFFLLAFVFTALMLEGWQRVALLALEFAVYTSCLLVEHYKFGQLASYESPFENMLGMLLGFVCVGLTLMVILLLHIRIYNRQQRQLATKNAILAEANRAKIQFLANASHEMRTPLTVISVNVQMVSGILKHMGETALDPQAQELLADAQSEIMRLSRMTGGMLTLASISENTTRIKADLSAILQSTADMLRLLVSKRGNKLETEIGDGFTVFCDVDLISQIAVNLIQNANAHTKNDVIRLCAVRNGETITVTVSDHGSGIAPELLPHVFERGVSGKNGASGGTGFGLFLCKTVVESHGGEIWVESEPEKGTVVYFTLPVYEGQYGGDEI